MYCMKILHLNAEEMGGGAPIAVRRLHMALNRLNGLSSIVGVKTKITDALNVRELPSFNPRVLTKVIDKCCNELVKLYKPTKDTPYSAYFLDNSVPTYIQTLKPDVIHLHWICNNFISPRGLRRIATLGIPVVWTFHDTWPFTGGCHITGNCNRWQNHCGNCPALGRSGILDISWWLWRAKKKAYAALKPVVVALNRKFYDSIKMSPLLSGCDVVILPNAIDSSIFRPIPKNIARSLLGLDPKAYYILFGACDSTSNRNKGFDLLSSAINALPKESMRNVSCLIFGASGAGTDANISLPAQYLGTLHDELTLAIIYSAADIFVCPSREENLPNTIMESLSCATPVVAFDVGGIPDMVEHGVNGMLVKPHDPQKMAEAISYILLEHEKRKNMSKAAREKVLRNYDMPIVARKYEALYKRVCLKEGARFF